VNFHRLQQFSIVKWILVLIEEVLIILCFAFILVDLIFDVQFLYFPDYQFGLAFLIIFIPILTLLLIDTWYRVYVHRNSALMAWAAGFTLFVFILIVILIGTITPGNEYEGNILAELLDSQSIMNTKAALFLIASFSLLLMIYGYIKLYIVNPLSIYSRVIASAERRTSGYLNGYSARPKSIDFIKIENQEMRRFSRFLLKNMLVWNIVGNSDSFILYFPQNERMIFSFKKSLSYMRIFFDGKAEVFIIPEDYNYLKVPISYSVLCDKVAERISKSYELFSRGKKKQALEVFRIEKIKKKNMSSNGSS